MFIPDVPAIKQRFQNYRPYPKVSNMSVAAIELAAEPSFTILSDKLASAMIHFPLSASRFISSFRRLNVSAMRQAEQPSFKEGVTPRYSIAVHGSGNHGSVLLAKKPAGPNI